MKRRTNTLLNPIHLQSLKRGLQHQRAGEWRMAEKCYRRVLNAAPKNCDVLNLMGTLLIQTGNASGAAALLERAVKVQPANAICRNNLGKALLTTGAPEKALPQLRRACELAPDLTEASMNLARAYRDLGRGEAAIRVFEQVLFQNPDLGKAMLALGDTYVDLGRITEAARLFRAALERDPDNVRAMIGLAAADEGSVTDEDLGRCEAVLRAGTLHRRAGAGLHAAAGRVYEKRRRYDEAFAHFERAKALADLDFDISRYEQFVNRCAEVFEPSFFASRKGWGDPSARPVFIVGMPRSGTTLVEQILVSHPDVGTVGEHPAMEKILRELADGTDYAADTFFRRVRDLGRKDVAALAKRYVSETRKHAASARFIIDKTPHNFEALGVVALMFPNARIVHCTRDPLDTCVSCFTHQLNRLHGYAKDLATLGRYYRAYQRLMDHFARSLPLTAFDVRYENLVSDQERASRALVCFLDVGWDDACLDFHKTERTVRTLSRTQVRRPIYQSSVGRWRHYARHLQPLQDALSAPA